MNALLKEAGIEGFPVLIRPDEPRSAEDHTLAARPALQPLHRRDPGGGRHDALPRRHGRVPRRDRHAGRRPRRERSSWCATARRSTTKIPLAKPEDNFESERSQVALQDDGKATIGYRADMNGTPRGRDALPVRQRGGPQGRADRHRQPPLRPGDAAEARVLEALGPLGARVDGLHVRGRRPAQPRRRSRADPPALVRVRLDFARGDREAAVRHPRRLAEQDGHDGRVKLPPKWKVATMPEDTLIEEPFARYELKRSVDRRRRAVRAHAHDPRPAHQGRGLPGVPPVRDAGRRGRSRDRDAGGGQVTAAGIRPPALTARPRRRQPAVTAQVGVERIGRRSLVAPPAPPASRPRSRAPPSARSFSTGSRRPRATRPRPARRCSSSSRCATTSRLYASPARLWIDEPRRRAAAADAAEPLRAIRDDAGAARARSARSPRGCGATLHARHGDDADLLGSTATGLGEIRDFHGDRAVRVQRRIARGLRVPARDQDRLRGGVPPATKIRSAGSRYAVSPAADVADPVRGPEPEDRRDLRARAALRRPAGPILVVSLRVRGSVELFIDGQRALAIDHNAASSSRTRAGSRRRS